MPSIACGTVGVVEVGVAGGAVGLGRESAVAEAVVPASPWVSGDLVG
jgi:hypothetical protein